MAYLSTTVNWDSIRSLTNPKVAEKIADNITRRIPLFYFLNKMGNKENEQGGYNYMTPVFKELQTAQAYTGTSVLNTIEADPVTTAIYERKQVTVPIVITGTKMLQNSGSNPEAIVDYLAMMVETAEESLKDGLSNQSTGIFSANGESDLGVTGLQNIIADSTTTGTVGGLSRATYSFWRQQTDSVATGFNTDGLASMSNLFYACVRGDESPTVIIMNRATYINFNRTLTYTNGTQSPLQFQVQGPTVKGDIAFEHTYFHGVPTMFDDYCPDQRAYFLNLKYMKLLVAGERDISMRDFITPADQDALVGRIYWAGNLICSNLARQGVLQGLPDTWA